MSTQFRKGSYFIPAADVIACEINTHAAFPQLYQADARPGSHPIPVL